MKTTQKILSSNTVSEFFKTKQIKSISDMIKKFASAFTQIHDYFAITSSNGP